MTKLVRFRRVVLPHRPGDTLAVPDEMAEKLIALGDVDVVPSVFDGQPDEPEPRPRRRTYQTRDAK